VSKLVGFGDDFSYHPCRVFVTVDLFAWGCYFLFFINIDEQ